MILRRRGLRALRAAVGAAVLVLLLSPSPPADAQVGVSPARWWDEVDRVGEVLEAGKWKKAAKRAGELREEVVRRSWRQPDLAQVLAELAFQLAVARANLNQDYEAVWEWHTALNFERMRGRREIIERDLAPYGRAAELLAAHPLRARGEYPPGYDAVDVRPDRDYEPPAPPGEFALTCLTNTTATREAVEPVTVEVLVDADGRLRHPVLLSPWSHPVVIQWTFDNVVRASPYRPARMEEGRVAVLQEIELHVTDAAPLQGSGVRME